ncbi:MAG: type I DNA topoisomerase [Planctomycetes bacterium]|nr:type I DNA topoisomerase [Planctomycetota bacterium]
MAAKRKDGLPVVIVESPAKARTIAKFLGSKYVIEASVGHVRDLPAGAEEIPEAYKKEKWARLGIDVDDDFKPLYVVPKEKAATIKKLKAAVKDASILYLATDEDREGESISWHLVQLLEPKVEVRRLVFHEITKEAILHALENPRELDTDLVEAQETRRIVDRLYGYSVSPLLWRKIKPRLSAGRVQSVAVRLIVERERERLRFVPADWWDLRGTFGKRGGDDFEAQLASVGGRRLASGKDFDPDTGRLKENGEPPLHLDDPKAKALAARLLGKPAKVEGIDEKPYTERPQPPFTTSTLQQEAGKKLGFAAKRTMRAAQRLYENGWITYMRTDSTTLSNEAIGAARTLIASQYGKEHVPGEPRSYQTKVKNAQEAHEAIRPAGSAFASPKSLGGELGDDERRLYELIWQRTVASQMKDSFGMRTTLTVAVDDARFTVSGRTIKFPGFRLAYEQQDDGDGKESGASEDRILPDVRPGDVLETRAMTPEDHTTKAPARLTEATLVKELEARGIGRPSTYASIIDTILQREYCFKKGNALVPTFTAFAVVNLLDKYLHWLVDYAFTAKMEDDLDEISNGRKRRLEYLKEFFSGNGQPGLKDRLTTVDGEIDPRSVCTLSDYAHLGEFDGQPIEVRVGRYGPFLSAAGVSVTLPDETAPDELTASRAIELLGQAAAGPVALGVDPASGLSIYVKNGRFGPYLQLGDAAALGDQKPKMASLLAGMTPETITLEQAIAVLSMPRNLGPFTLPEGETEAGQTFDVTVHNGRFGPFVKCGKATRSIPAGESPLTITLDRAAALLSTPKVHGRAARSQPKVMRELGKHATSGRTLNLLEGRYGPYVSDGEVHASLQKDEDAGAITLERAVELIDAKAARGGGGKRRRGPSRAGPRSKAAGPKATAKSRSRRSKADAD